MHVDATSITLAVNGRVILVHPGTYRYNDVPEFRKYFKGTRAHNTVSVDVEDQAIKETGFVLSRPFKTTLGRASETSDGMIIECSHDGYTRLRNPQYHHRQIVFSNGHKFLIQDTVSGKGIHDFELNYYLHPGATAAQINGWWGVAHDGEKVFIRLLADGAFNLIVGQKNPLLGWFSAAYGIKRKCGVLSSLRKGEARQVTFLTAICLGSPMDSGELPE
jgi:hypothetical protein